MGLLLSATNSTIKMKYLIIACLIAAATVTVDGQEVDDLVECSMTLGAEACEALEPMPYLDNGYFLTDDQIEALVMEKLKLFQWIVGKVAGPGVEGFVRQFIEANRDMVVGALKQGGIALLNMLKDLVANIMSKIG